MHKMLILSRIFPYFPSFTTMLVEIEKQNPKNYPVVRYFSNFYYVVVFKYIDNSRVDAQKYGSFRHISKNSNKFLKLFTFSIMLLK